MQTVAIVLLIADLALLLLVCVPIANVLSSPVDTLAWCGSRDHAV